MNLNRRDFIAAPAAALATSLFAAETAVPWQRKIRRVGQTNMTEHDPAALDVEQWADYWASLNQRHRHSGVLPDEGAISQERQVPRKPRFLRRVLRGRQESRPARDRAHESGPQLGR